MPDRRDVTPGTPRTLIRLALAAILILSATVSPAKVFLRWSSATQSTRALESAGGKVAYEAPVTINGGKGALVVLGFDRQPQEVARILERTFKLDSLTFGGGSMGFASAASEGVAVRFLFVQSSEVSKTLLFKIEQTAEEFKRSAAPPARHLLEAVPACPQSEPAFFLQDEEAGMSLAVATTRTSPASVMNFYRSQLPRLGWTPALAPRSGAPQPPAVNDSPLQVFVRGPEMCTVFVESSGDTGETRITLLHKRQGMK